MLMHHSAESMSRLHAHTQKRPETGCSAVQRAKGYIRIQVPNERTVKWLSKVVQSHTIVYVCVVWRESDGRRAGDASLRS